MSIATPLAIRPDTSRRVTFGRVCRSEFIKLRTVRSTAWSYFIAVLLFLGLSLLYALQMTNGIFFWSGHEANALNLVFANGVQITVAQLVIVPLGVLVISGEYATGMIRSTLTAIPKRTPVLAAKALVFAITTFAITLFTIMLAWVVGASVFLSKGKDVAINADTIGLAVAAAGYLTLIGMFVLGIGTIMRSTAGGITASLGIILVLPIVSAFLPGFVRDAARYLPSNAGAQMYSRALPAGAGSADALTPEQGFLVLLAWTALSLLGATVALKRRDA